MITPTPKTAIYNPKRDALCPIIFKKWVLFKSMWAAPLIALGVAALIGLVYYSLHNHLSHAWLSFFTAMGFCFLCAAGGSLLVLPIFLPYCFLRQTATPSCTQKIIRFYCCNIMGWGNPAGIPHYEIVAFKWWLSHPDQPWPDQLKVLAKDIDTDKFDWQNPKEWPF